ncbi:MAG: GxxExxY protein [Acidobacteria bacterium]|nr:GxxExxY protein [Acidobacteriota bacterium]
MLYGDDVDLTDRIIACGIEVHRHFGPGLSESVYESALCIELEAARLAFSRQVGIPLYYKGTLISEHRPDLVVASRVIVEGKSVERLDRIHLAQVLTYLRVSGLRTGLLLNFNSAMLKQGIRRVRL